ERGRDAFDEPCSNLALGHDRPVLDTTLVNQMDRVVVAAKGTGSYRDIVGEDPIAALALPLEPGVVDDIIGLGRKPDNERRPVVAVLSDAGEDVGVLRDPQHRQ